MDIVTLGAAKSYTDKKSFEGNGTHVSIGGVPQTNVNFIGSNGVVSEVKTGETTLNIHDKDLGDISKFTKSTIITDYTKLESTAYSEQFTSGTSYSQADTYIIQAQENDVFLLTGTMIDANWYAVCMLYNDNSFVKSVGLYQDGNSGSYTDYLVTIPTGVNKIVVCNNHWKSFTIKKKIVTNVCDVLYAKSYANNYVEYKNNILTIKGKYNSTEDIVFVFNKNGNNNLFNFQKIYTVKNEGSVNTNLTVYRNMIETVNTDWFSPHQFYVTNNIDGDLPNDYFLTGGNHNKNNVVTATTSEIKVLCDNVLVSDFTGFANSVTVQWTNLIQARNTWKADGTGRNALKEIVKITIIGTKIEVDIQHVALEDMYRSVYYGLQAVTSPYTTLYYVAGQTRTPYTIPSDTNSGNKQCREMLHLNYSTKDCLSMKLYTDDLGDFSKNTLTYSAFTGVYGKSYFNIVGTSSYKQNKDEIYLIRGCYNFYSN